jgi:hypothetical protein
MAPSTLREAPRPTDRTPLPLRPTRLHRADTRYNRTPRGRAGIGAPLSRYSVSLTGSRSWQGRESLTCCRTRLPIRHGLDRMPRPPSAPTRRNAGARLGRHSRAVQLRTPRSQSSDLLTTYDAAASRGHVRASSSPCWTASAKLRSALPGPRTVRSPIHGSPRRSDRHPSSARRLVSSPGSLTRS